MIWVFVIIITIFSISEVWRFREITSLHTAILTCWIPLSSLIQRWSQIWLRSFGATLLRERIGLRVSCSSRLNGATLIRRSFLIMLHLGMRSCVRHPLSSIRIDFSRWSLLSLHLLLSTISLHLLLLSLLLGRRSLSLKYSIDPLNKIRSFRNCWTLRRCRLLHMWNRIKMFWLSSFCHLVIRSVIGPVLALCLLLFQQSDRLLVSLVYILFTQYWKSWVVWHLKILLLTCWASLRSIYLLKDGVLNASKTKTTVENRSAVILVSLSKPRILM